MYISVVMDCVTVRVLNLSSVLSSNGCNFHTDFDLLSFFLFTRCEDGPHAGPKHVVVSPMY